MADQTQVSREILKILVGVLRRELMLAADQVTIYNQRWIIPPDSRLYISLKISGSHPYAANRRYRSGTIVETPTQSRSVLLEEQSINLQDLLTLNIYSHGEAARLRRNEAPLALSSDYAEQQMEASGFSIGPVPVSFVDTSEGEGTDMITRYAVTHNLLYAQGKTQPVEYYDDFTFARTLRPVLQP